LRRDHETTVISETEIPEERRVRSSTGHVELRPVIRTSVKLLNRVWPIELTLTNRDEMGCRPAPGGAAERIRITPEERSTAVRAARTMGLNVSGVDLLRSNHGPVVMEINSSPGLEWEICMDFMGDVNRAMHDVDCHLWEPV